MDRVYSLSAFKFRCNGDKLGKETIFFFQFLKLMFILNEKNIQIKKALTCEKWMRMTFTISSFHDEKKIIQKFLWL